MATAAVVLAISITTPLWRPLVEAPQGEGGYFARAADAPATDKAVYRTQMSEEEQEEENRRVRWADDDGAKPLAQYRAIPHRHDDPSHDVTQPWQWGARRQMLMARRASAQKRTASQKRGAATRRRIISKMRRQGRAPFSTPVFRGASAPDEAGGSTATDRTVTKLDGGHLFFSCPNCGGSVFVERGQTNCKIFRHATYKANGRQVPPHSSKATCDSLLARVLVNGCARPFRLVATPGAESGWEVETCGYI
jgi:hypothetical protein